MQFSLFRIFVVVTLIGVYCGLAFAAPTPVGLVALTFLTTLLPPVIVGGVIYGRGTARAFWIGCASSGFIPFVICLYLSVSVVIALLGNDWDDLDDEGWILTSSMAVCHALVFVNGFVVVLTKWLHTPRDHRRNSEQPSADTVHRRDASSEPLQPNRPLAEPNLT